MVLGNMSPDQPRFYSDSEREQLRLTNTPRRACVWLVACVEQETIYDVA